MATDKKTITWEDFVKIDLRAGTIIRAEIFERARNPAYKVWVDLGELGVKQSSAQIVHHYRPDALIGKKVLCVCNFAPKNIAGFLSEVLITGFYDADGHVVLATADKEIHNGAQLG